MSGQNLSGRITCPFCGGWYELRGAPDLDGFHSLPICSKFREMDLLEFAIEARKAMGITVDTDN